MSDKIREFADQFPVAEYDPDRCQPPQIGLTSYITELLEIAGYTEPQIHRGVEKKIPDDAYKPTDIEYTDTMTFPVYVAEDSDSSAHMVGYEDTVLPPLSEHGLSQADYEKMRIHHEVADADITVCLTPFDLLLCDGLPLYAGDSPEPPITSYPLHEYFDSDLSEDLQSELEPPSYFS